MINKIGIDLLCVASHYSYRNDNSDNFLMNSVVNKPIAIPGTYYGNRRMSEETSLTYKIF
jgi:hypothetical protein